MTTTPDKPFDAFAPSWPEAQQLLAVRLHPRSALEGEEARSLVWVEALPGVGGLVVYDLPNMVAPVPREHLGSWRLSTDEVFRKGIDNVRCLPKLGRSDQEVGPGVSVTILADAERENLLAATHALFLEDYFKPFPAGGIVFGIPQRRCVLCLPVHRRSAGEAISLLRGILQDMHREGPDSLSPVVFWARDGGTKEIDRLPESLPADLKKTLQSLP